MIDPLDPVWNIALDSYLQGAKDVGLTLGEIFADHDMPESAILCATVINAIESQIEAKRKQST